MDGNQDVNPVEVLNRTEGRGTGKMWGNTDKSRGTFRNREG